jgi:magnesium transporter
MSQASEKLIEGTTLVDGFTVRIIAADADKLHPTSLADLTTLAHTTSGVVWLDIVQPSDEQLAPLETAFGLSPLALEDAVTPHERPKIDAYADYWFLVVHAATIGDDRIIFHEMAIFACERLLITVRRDPAFPIKEVESRLAAHADRCVSGSGYLLYTILDTVVDGYLPVAEMFVERVEDIEDRLFSAGSHLHEAVLPEIFRRKKEAQYFRRAAVPMRDILNQIVREDVDIFSSEEIPYFRDVYDHAVRVIDELDSARDLVSSALDIHLSVTANRQNEVAKQLTVIATIFLPLGFLTGFFGQNFGFLVKHITGTGSFVILGLGTEVVAILALVLFFKIRGWY